eukprot:g1623.t1
MGIMGNFGEHHDKPRPVPTATPARSSELAARFDVVIFLSLLLLLLSATSFFRRAVGQAQRIVSLVVGVVIGAVIYYCAPSDAAIMRFSDDLFFYILIPPVVFAEAFTVRKIKFFSHIGTVCAFGFAGALLQSVLLGYALYATARAGVHDELDRRNPSEALLLAAALSSSEGAALINEHAFPRLHSLAHGEGVLNDPASIVVFTAVVRGSSAGDAFVFDGGTVGQIALELLRIGALSIAIGAAAALYGAKVVRVAREQAATATAAAAAPATTGGHGAARSHGRDEGSMHSLAAVQVAMVLAVSYLSYLSSEALELSGTLTIFVCALGMAQFAFRSMTPAAQLVVTHVASTLSFVIDLCLYTYIGMNVFSLQRDWRAADTWRNSNNVTHGGRAGRGAASGGGGGGGLQMVKETNGKSISAMVVAPLTTVEAKMGIQ